MQNRYRRLLLVVNVSLWVVVGVAGHALALTFTEFPIPTAGSRSSVITTGPDGALWFTEFESSKIVRITAAGVITEFPIPGRFRELESITTGSDGALWFTEFGTNQIGRITTGGVITDFNIPTATSDPPGHHDGAGRRAVVHRVF